MFLDQLATLTREQQEKFNEIKDAATLYAFLSETKLTMTDEEKARVLASRTAGKQPLADEELDSVAGGATEAAKLKCTKCGSTDTAVRYIVGVEQKFCFTCLRFF